jgi:arylsulfatase A-like enzyme
MALSPVLVRSGLAAGARTGIGTLLTGTPAGTSGGPIGTTPVGSSSTTPGIPPVAEPTLPAHHVVLIVVDAARPDYLALAQLPHIRDLMRRGTVYDRAWVGELESSTPNVHVTFGTGTLPRENGFLGFGWATPQTRKQVDFRTLLADHGIDPVLRALPVPGVAARLHNVFPNSTSVAVSGHKDYAVVGLGGGSATYELYGKFEKKLFVPAFLHAPPPLTAAERAQLTIKQPLPLGAEDAWAFKYASIMVNHVKPKLLMINLPEEDTWGHWYGPDNTAVFTKLMTNLDRGIGELEAAYQQQGLLGRTDFIITGDHAMVQSHGAKSWGDVAIAAKQAGTSVARGDVEGGAVWLQDPGKAKAVADRLVAIKPAHSMAIFYRSALGDEYHYIQASPMKWLVRPAESAALQYLVNTTAGRNGPDLWVLYRENYTVVPRNVQGIWKGTHGGATWKVQHVPLIMAGPDVKQGVHSRFPARAIDIAPTIERLLGLPPIRRDGVVLADSLQDASKPESSAQKEMAFPLDSFVNAMKSQSASDDRSQVPWPALPPPPYQCLAQGPGESQHNICTVSPTNG